MSIVILGIDLGKMSCSIVGLDASGAPKFDSQNAKRLILLWPMAKKCNYLSAFRLVWGALGRRRDPIVLGSAPQVQLARDRRRGLHGGECAP